MKEKIKKFINNRGFIIGLISLLIIAIIISGTYAWFTWQSENNPSITLTIGEFADVTFTNGTDISTNDLAPVFNYKDGDKTTFSINHKGLTSSVIAHTITLNITTISQELRNESLKYKLISDNNHIIAEGDFSQSTDNSSIVLTDTLGLDAGTTEYSFYIYIDGNVENSSNMMNQNLTGSIDVAVSKLDSAPLSDFEYAIGSWDVSGDGSQIIEIPTGRILLTKYIGTNPVVNVSSIYNIDGVNYTPIVYADNPNHQTGTFYENKNITEVNFASGIFFADFYNGTSLTYNSARHLFKNCTSLVRVTGLSDEITQMNNTFIGNSSLTFAKVPSSTTTMKGTFGYCTSLVNAPVIPDSVIEMNTTFYGCTSLVTAPEIPDSVINMYGTFHSCSSLVNAPVIPDSVANLEATFIYCTSLVTAPAIPDSVTDLTMTFACCTSLVNTPEIPNSVTIMIRTFSGCTSLVNAPAIPNSVTDMYATFEDCTSLVNAPEIPNSVTNMPTTFYNCTSLVNAPEIPSSVTNISSIFRNCTNLKGTVRINSSNITAYAATNHPFYNTSNQITVEVPSGSTTYTSINTNKPSNITIITY
ncbi:MAG: leucine-rich repeat protein [Bacilli bacterium]|nr:leucine-rich repeat protein [Bacilli bacterium]